MCSLPACAGFHKYHSRRPIEIRNKADAQIEAVWFQSLSARMAFARLPGRICSWVLLSPATVYGRATNGPKSVSTVVRTLLTSARSVRSQCTKLPQAPARSLTPPFALALARPACTSKLHGPPEPQGSLEPRDLHTAAPNPSTTCVAAPILHADAIRPRSATLPLHPSICSFRHLISRLHLVLRCSSTFHRRQRSISPRLGPPASSPFLFGSYRRREDQGTT